MDRSQAEKDSMKIEKEGGSNVESRIEPKGAYPE
jgi:hypothetical protein